MTIHQNLIAGERVGSDAARNINPSNTDDEILVHKDELGLLSREEGKYASEFYTTVKTAYTLA